MAKRGRASRRQRAAGETVRRGAPAVGLARQVPWQRTAPGEVTEPAPGHPAEWDRLDGVAQVSRCAPGCQVCAGAEEQFGVIRAESVAQRRRFDEPDRYPYAARKCTLHRIGCREIEQSVGHVRLYNSVSMQGALTEFAHAGTTNTGWATHMRVMDRQEAAAWITERIGPRGGVRYRLCRICRPVLPDVP